MSVIEREADGELTEVLRFGYLAWQLSARGAVWDGCKVLFLACGIRSGKDRCATQVVIEVSLWLAVQRAEYFAAHPEEPPLIPLVNVWVVAPTRKLFTQNWREYEKAIPQTMRTDDHGENMRTNRQDGIMTLRGGIEISFKSADTPGHLVAEGVDIVHITEPAEIKSNQVWEQDIKTRLVSPGRLGLAIIAGVVFTRKGHWHRDLGEDCKREEERAKKEGRKPTARVFELPSSCNPDVTDIEEMRKTFRKHVFDAAVLAIWPGDECAPFQRDNLDAVFQHAGSDYNGSAHITAIDCALRKDLCAVTRWTLETTPQCIKRLKMRGLKIHEQIDKIVQFYHAAPGKIILDVTGIGDAYYQLLQLRLPGVPIIPYDFRGRRKIDLCDTLVTAVQERCFIIRTDLCGDPADYNDLNPDGQKETLRWQFDHFEAEMTSSKDIDFHGPNGQDDDLVFSVALGIWLWRQTPVYDDDFEVHRDLLAQFY